MRLPHYPEKAGDGPLFRIRRKPPMIVIWSPEMGDSRAPRLQVRNMGVNTGRISADMGRRFGVDRLSPPRYPLSP